MYDLEFAGNRSIFMKIRPIFFLRLIFNAIKKKKRLKSILCGKEYNIQFAQN